MPDESEVIHADVGVPFHLPNGRTLTGRPVAYPQARRIMALLHEYDRTGNFEQTIEPALVQFGELAGIPDEDVMRLCPNMSLGELVVAIQRFFFHRRPAIGNGAAKPVQPDSTKPRPGEPGA
jgi:hypothetical protein